ncbi:MAG: DNA methyltransferase [Verrucomicrobiota bacterium]
MAASLSTLKSGRRKARGYLAEIAAFREFGLPTRKITTTFRSTNGAQQRTSTFVNEFWTAKQRQASSLHEVSYRACFKPQLPRFFIERLTRPGDVVYDPFMGRGTTPVEAALLGRVPWGNDINPLSLTFTQPRLRPPTLEQIAARLGEIDLTDHDEFPKDLLAFYHPETLREICALKKHFLNAPSTTPARRSKRRADTAADTPTLDAWIRMVALNRLTGHSPGFFSVYTLPPNQAVSVASQRKINAKRNQKPPRRDVAKLILKKSKQLLRDATPEVRRTLNTVTDQARFTNCPAAATRKLPANSVSLVVTSPPFLDVVQYADDNWLRCWFLGIDPASVALTVPRKLNAWAAAMTGVFHELQRVLKPGGHVAFEVGEVHAGKTKLEETVLPCGVTAGLDPVPGAHQRPEIHQDRQLLGRGQHEQRDEHQSHRAVPQTMNRLLLILAALATSATVRAATNTTTAALAELTKPAKQIPFKEVIRATTQHRLLDFDTNNVAHRELFQHLTAAAEAALTNAHAAGLFTARANEAGNHMETFVKAALKTAGLVAQTPVTASGRAQSTGYPDVEITGAVPCYLELKTYSADTVNTTQRSFYFSPSENPKVTRDALHLLLAFELEKIKRDNREVFVPIRWKLITLQDLNVDLKFEFNQNNRGLYGQEAKPAVLSEGKAD